MLLVLYENRQKSNQLQCYLFGSYLASLLDSYSLSKMYAMIYKVIDLNVLVKIYL